MATQTVSTSLPTRTVKHSDKHENFALCRDRSHLAAAREPTMRRLPRKRPALGLVDARERALLHLHLQHLNYTLRIVLFPLYRLLQRIQISLYEL